jgi:hypothetical protein
MQVIERQTKTQQKQIIDAARKQGKLGDLFWFVNAYIPGRHFSDGKFRVQPAVFPKTFVPVIPLAPDEVVARHDADILCELFRFGNIGRGIEMVVELTDIHELRSGNWQWYEWGRTWDCVCVICGGVFADTSPGIDVCGGCVTSG